MELYVPLSKAVLPSSYATLFPLLAPENTKASLTIDTPVKKVAESKPPQTEKPRVVVLSKEAPQAEKTADITPVDPPQSQPTAKEHMLHVSRQFLQQYTKQAASSDKQPESELVHHLSSRYFNLAKTLCNRLQKNSMRPTQQIMTFYSLCYVLTQSGSENYLEQLLKDNPFSLTRGTCQTLDGLSKHLQQTLDEQKISLANKTPKKQLLETLQRVRMWLYMSPRKSQPKPKAAPVAKQVKPPKNHRRIKQDLTRYAGAILDATGQYLKKPNPLRLFLSYSPVTGRHRSVPHQNFADRAKRKALRWVHLSENGKTSITKQYVECLVYFHCLNYHLREQNNTQFAGLLQKQLRLNSLTCNPTNTPRKGFFSKFFGKAPARQGTVPAPQRFGFFNRTTVTATPRPHSMEGLLVTIQKALGTCDLKLSEDKLMDLVTRQLKQFNAPPAHQPVARGGFALSA